MSFGFGKDSLQSRRTLWTVRPLSVSEPPNSREPGQKVPESASEQPVSSANLWSTYSDKGAFVEKEGVLAVPVPDESRASGLPYVLTDITTYFTLLVGIYFPSVTGEPSRRCSQPHFPLCCCCLCAFLCVCVSLLLPVCLHLCSCPSLTAPWGHGLYHCFWLSLVSSCLSVSASLFLFHLSVLLMFLSLSVSL